MRGEGIGAYIMFHAYGLYSHIRANRLRSALLLAGFVALLHVLLFSILLLWSAFMGGTFDEIVAGAAGNSPAPGRSP